MTEETKETSKVKKIEVYDISTTEENLTREADDANTPIGQYKTWLTTYGIDLSSFLPKKTKYFVKFKIRNVYPALANALRRGYVSEYKCLSMLCDYKTDIASDDEYILVDYIRKHIEGIPFQQDNLPDLEYMQKNWQISIDIKNELSRRIWVYSRDIHVYDKHEKKEIHGLFEGTIRLTQLNSNKFLHAKITLGVGTGEMNGNAYKPCGQWIYADLDCGKQHILSYEPIHFQLGYQTYGNFKEPFGMIRSICKNLIARVQRIKDIIEEFEDIEHPANQITDIVHVTDMGPYYKYYFNGETITIANLFRDYLINEVHFVNSGKDHPSNDTVFVKINIHFPHKVMIATCKKIIKDIETVFEAF